MTIDTGLEMNPDLIAKLKEGRTLWLAAHNDGSDNRINGEAILDAASYHTAFGILATLFMWIRKTFRNRGKTTEDLAAEKEAAGINRTCGALEVMLVEYIQSAQDNTLNEETLDELIDTLGKMHEYEQAGKLMIPNRDDLAEIRSFIARYTDVLAKGKSVQPVHETGRDEFSLIRDQLIRQRELIRSTP